MQNKCSVTHWKINTVCFWSDETQQKVFPTFDKSMWKVDCRNVQEIYFPGCPFEDRPRQGKKIAARWAGVAVLSCK